MFAVIFEVQPKKERWNDYLDLANISNLSWKRSSTTACRRRGGFEIFEDYHLRVGEVTDDSDPPRGLAVSKQRFDETANPVTKELSITELSPLQGAKPKIAAEHLGAQLRLDKYVEGLVNHEIFRESCC